MSIQSDNKTIKLIKYKKDNKNYLITRMYIDQKLVYQMPLLINDNEPVEKSFTLPAGTYEVIVVGGGGGSAGSGGGGSSGTTGNTANGIGGA